MIHCQQPLLQLKVLHLTQIGTPNNRMISLLVLCNFCKFDSKQKMLDCVCAGVQSAEPDHKLYAMDFSARGPPNDPAFPDQWGMHQLDLYSPDAAILQGTPPAWAYTQGSSSIIVCVIDSGIDYNHPDLAPNIWTNAGEIPGNGIDDDHNGAAHPDCCKDLRVLKGRVHQVLQALRGLAVRRYRCTVRML